MRHDYFVTIYCFLPMSSKRGGKLKALGFSHPPDLIKNPLQINFWFIWDPHSLMSYFIKRNTVAIAAILNL